MLFRGDYFFLSNFYLVDIFFRGEVYSSVEHAYQATKVLYPHDKEKIKNAFTPAKAKILAKSMKHRKMWNTFKDGIMYELVKIKFTNDDLREKLLATGDIEIVEDNHWFDTYWGKYEGEGLNKLGKILMQVREELK